MNGTLELVKIVDVLDDPVNGGFEGLYVAFVLPDENSILLV